MGTRKYAHGTEKQAYSNVRNEFIKEKYDRFNLTFPKGKKEVYQDLARTEGLSLNALINKLLEEYAENHK